MIRIFAHTTGDSERVQAAVEGPFTVVRDAAAVVTGAEGDTTGLIIACRSWTPPSSSPRSTKSSRGRC